MSVEWTDELKAEVIKSYEDASPTAETSTEIVKQIAEDIEATVNGVRAILVRAEVYIKKAAAASTEKKAGGTRVSKAAAIEELTNLLEANSIEVEEDIVGKMTGKAAVYFTGVINSLTNED